MKVEESTKISIGLAITMIGGGAVWLTSISIQTEANAKTLEQLDVRQVKYLESIQNIEKDLAVIRTKVELLGKLHKRGE